MQSLGVKKAVKELCGHEEKVPCGDKCNISVPVASLILIKFSPATRAHVHVHAISPVQGLFDLIWIGIGIADCSGVCCGAGQDGWMD